MSWDCGYCTRSDGREHSVDAVCHHCGMLLCGEHQYVHRWDTALASGSGLRGAQGVHCRDCLRAHHPRVEALVRIRR